MTDRPAIGNHLATLNLFREPDGTVEITVASANGFFEEQCTCHRYTAIARACPLHGPDEQAPIEKIEALVVEAAMRMAERHGCRSITPLPDKG